LSAGRVRIGDASMTAGEALGRPDVPLGAIEAQGLTFEFDDRFGGDVDRGTLVAECRYRGYLKRQTESLIRARLDEDRVIPVDFVYSGIPGLSREVVERLTTVRPRTVGQAARVPGVTPAAAAIVAARIYTRGRLPVESEDTRSPAD
jgi:tRNA uridine 5-carboxymethylaminomethyl modification enzyme